MPQRKRNVNIGRMPSVAFLPFTLGMIWAIISAIIIAIIIVSILFTRSFGALIMFVLPILLYLGFFAIGKKYGENFTKRIGSKKIDAIRPDLSYIKRS